MCVPVAATLLFWWCKKKGPELKRAVRHAIVPLALCVALTGAVIGYYDWKLTGHALLLPYQLNERTYFVSPLFIFQHPRPQPAYRNDALRDFYLSFDLAAISGDAVAPRPARFLVQSLPKDLAGAAGTSSYAAARCSRYSLSRVRLQSRSAEIGASAFLFWAGLLSIAGARRRGLRSPALRRADGCLC